ncbi:hypothetical protein H0H93_007755, partial [Arthromyces matolae]
NHPRAQTEYLPTRNLSDLPVELIQEIGYYLQPSPLSSPQLRAEHFCAKAYPHRYDDPITKEIRDARRSLSALSRVSHATRRPIEPLLYKEVLLKASADVVSAGANFSLLLRTLQQRPYAQRYSVALSPIGPELEVIEQVIDNLHPIGVSNQLC